MKTRRTRNPHSTAARWRDGVAGTALGTLLAGLYLLWAGITDPYVIIGVWVFAAAACILGAQRARMVRARYDRSTGHG